MLASVLAILNLERGIFYTAWEMIKSPGVAMRRYLFEDRTGFIEPLKFLVLTIPIYLFLTFNWFPEVSFFAGMEEGAADHAEHSGADSDTSPVGPVIMQLKEYADILLLLTIPVSAFWTRIFFRSFRLNFGEHLVLNAFLYGFLTLISTFLLPIAWLSADFLGYLFIALYLFYTAYFLGSVFYKGWGKAILYSMLLNGLSILSSMILLLAIILTLMLSTGKIGSS